MILDQDVIAAALKLQGTPYRHQGRQPGLALDCAGVIVCVCRDVGAKYDDAHDYTHLKRTEVLSIFDRCSARESTLLPARALIFHLGSRENDEGISHMAISLPPRERGGPMWMIHGWRSFKKTWPEPITDSWMSRLAGIYRFVEVDSCLA